MSNSLIKPKKELGYSNIFLDFIDESNNTRPFYPAGSLSEVANQLDKLDYNRDQLAEILIGQNQSFGASELVFENIKKFKQPNSVAVFTGQQAGLFGGSLLIIIKAFAIVKAAAEYEKELGRPVVPIFWIAGDDHDYEEVNHTYLLDRNSQINKIQYDSTPEIEHSTSALKFSDEEALSNAFVQLKETLGETDFTAETYQLLENCYTSSDNYVSGFGKLMAALTKKTGLIFFSPGHPSAKKISVPFFKNIIECQTELHQRLSLNNQQLLDLGYHNQVEKKENSVHLFYEYNGRKPILFENNKYQIGELSLTKEELLSRIESEPENFSPDVMTRPIFQSYLFPVISQKGGAAEIAYLAQIHNLFELFSLETPYYKSRPTATIIEKRYESLMLTHDIEFEELIGDVEQLINRIMSKSFPENIEERFTQFRKHIECHFEDFSDITLEFDQSLKPFAKQTMGKIDFTIKAFEGKVFSAHKKKSKDTRDRIYRLWHSLYPNRSFQERVISPLYFISKYGFEFIDFLFEKLESEEKAHQLIKLSEMDK